MDFLAPMNPGELRDGDLQLELSSFAPHPVHKVPTYQFRMVHAGTAEELGGIRLRVGSTPHIELYAGHIGYAVHPRNHMCDTAVVGEEDCLDVKRQLANLCLDDGRFS